MNTNTKMATILLKEEPPNVRSGQLVAIAIGMTPCLTAEQSVSSVLYMLP
jgi:hypothetical protein